MADREPPWPVLMFYWFEVKKMPLEEQKKLASNTVRAENFYAQTPYTKD